MQGTAGEHADTGRLRERQVFIGSRDAPIQAARFVPAPFGDQLRAGLEDWVRWVNDPPSDLPAVVSAGLAHYQFETLHPFSDGNGRIGRLLIVLQLLRQRVLTHPILVVSPWFETRRTEYQDALLTLSQDGDWDNWIRFFARGVGASAETLTRGSTLCSLGRTRPSSAFATQASPGSQSVSRESSSARLSFELARSQRSMAFPTRAR